MRWPCVWRLTAISLQSLCSSDVNFLPMVGVVDGAGSPPGHRPTMATHRKPTKAKKQLTPRHVCKPDTPATPPSSHTLSLCNNPKRASTSGLATPAHMYPTRGSSRRNAARRGAASATVLGLCALGVLPPPAAAELECRIKKMVTSRYVDTSSHVHYRGESYPGHIYATVASTDCATDAAGLSSRAATAAGLRCSTQTNYPASTTSGNSTSGSWIHRVTINPSATMSFETLGSNLLDGENARKPRNSDSLSRAHVHSPKRNHTNRHTREIGVESSIGRHPPPPRPRCALIFCNRRPLGAGTLQRTSGATATA